MIVLKPVVIIALAVVCSVIATVAIQQADAVTPDRNELPAWTNDLLKYHISGVVTADEFRNAIAYVDTLPTKAEMAETAYAKERQIQIDLAQESTFTTNNDVYDMSDCANGCIIDEDFRTPYTGNTSPLLHADFSDVEITDKMSGPGHKVGCSGLGGQAYSSCISDNNKQYDYYEYESIFAPEQRCIHEVQYDPIQCYGDNYVNGHISLEYYFYMKDNLAYLYR